MNLTPNATHTERFAMNWQRLLAQGFLIFLTGLTFATASVLQSDAVIMGARYFSWLPVCGMALLGMGLLECLDALLAKQQRDFFQNLQVGTLDIVVGCLIILSVNETPERLGLLLAAFLLERGIVRTALTFALKLPQKPLMLLCGGVSIIMGVMVWLGWPIREAWFLALCLSVEIAFRGCTMGMFALWVRMQKRQPRFENATP